MVKALGSFLRNALPGKLSSRLADAYHEFSREVVGAPSFPSLRDSLRYRLNALQGVLLKLAGSTKVAYPAHYLIELTNLCNLRCVTCPREYELGRQMDKGLMDLEDFKKIVDEAHPYARTIGLIGLGETFLYDKLEEAVDYVLSKSRNVLVFTSINANTKDCVEQVRALAGKMGFFQISVDGVGELFGDIRRKGEFSLLVENTRKIVEITAGSGSRVAFNMVVYDTNYRHMTKVVQLAHDLGVGAVTIYPMNLVAATGWDKERVYSFYGSKEFEEELAAARGLARSLGLRFGHFPFEQMNGFRRCHYPRHLFSVTWDGYLIACPCKPFPLVLNFGNVLRDGLLRSLNSGPFRRFRRMWLEGESPDFCKDCSYIDIAPVDIGVHRAAPPEELRIQ